MKKALVVLLGLCMVFALSCETTGSAASSEQPVPGGSLAPITVELRDNFQYGNSYAGDIRIPNLMNGYRIMNGDSFTLKVTYTVSRDLTNPIWVGLVDQSAGSDYWNPLSWRQSSGEGSGVFLSEGAPRAGQTYTVEVTMTAVKNSPGATPAHNTVRMETVGTRGSPTAVVNFTEFVLTKR